MRVILSALTAARGVQGVGSLGKAHSLPSYTSECPCHILLGEGRDQWLLAFSGGESLSGASNKLS